MSSTYVFTLYVTGGSPRSHTATEKLRSVLDQQLPGAYELKIIDILQDPELVEKEKILATPTVVRETPGPQRRVIGDLSDAFFVINGLDLPTLPLTGALNNSSSNKPPKERP